MKKPINFSNINSTTYDMLTNQPNQVYNDYFLKKKSQIIDYKNFYNDENLILKMHNEEERNKMQERRTGSYHHRIIPTIQENKTLFRGVNISSDQYQKILD